MARKRVKDCGIYDPLTALPLAAICVKRGGIARENSDESMNKKQCWIGGIDIYGERELYQQDHCKM